MPRYTTDQKEIVKRIIDSANDEVELDLLYSVLAPSDRTIKRWLDGKEEKKSCWQRAWQWIRDDPYKIGWFISELLMVLAIGIVSLFCFAICVVLLGEANPAFIAPSSDYLEVTTGIPGLIPWLALGVLALSAIFAYIYTSSEDKLFWAKVTSMCLSVVSLIALIVYLVWFIVSISVSTHPALMIIICAFFTTIIFSYICFWGSWKDPSAHDGYKSIMDLITILALVITISIAAFTLLNGETFPEKLMYLQGTLGL